MSSASTTEFSSPTDTGGGPTSGTPRGANYFFGFLITFVGLLIIFIICGIGSRRRLARRRRLNDALQPRFIKLEGEEKRPQFYEPPLVVGEDRWSNLMVRTMSCLCLETWSLLLRFLAIIRQILQREWERSGWTWLATTTASPTRTSQLKHIFFVQLVQQK